MKKSFYLFFYAMIFLAIVTSPFWLWKLKPEKDLNVLILDKTVPNSTYREHKGFVWVLNNTKYFKDGKPYSVENDYKGFEPKSNQKYSIVPLPRISFIMGTYADQ